jgi:phospholipid/cholesterol/gamma-HCH transport system substrate-binding protein
MNESSNKRAVTVGIFVLLGLIFLIAGVITIGNMHSTFTNKIHLVTVLDDVNGLQKGNNIWFSGVKIGTVKKVEFYGASRVRVTMNINQNSRQYIRKDAKVKVSTDGFIGNKIMVIYGGTSRYGEVEEGDTLSVEKSFSTEDIMNTLQENNKNLLSITANLKTITTDINEGKGSIGKLMKDESLYRDLSSTGASLKSASEKANQAMGSISAFSSGLNKKGTLANQLVTDTSVFSSIKRSAKQLNVITDTATSMITELNRAAHNNKSPIGVLLYDEASGTHLKSTLKNLDSGSKKLDEDLEAAQSSFLLRKYFRKKAKNANTQKP